MIRLSLQEVLRKIDLTETFEAQCDEAGFKIKVSSYAPIIATAIHAGSGFREELSAKTALSTFERWQEEDPCTDNFIDGLPVTITALDSRYEYDLNRSQETCIYDDAWGKMVWNTPLTSEERETSLTKHRNFYVLIDHLVRKLEGIFREVFIFDLHSYNYQRKDSPEGLPLFNLGSFYLKDSFREKTDFVMDSLKNISLDHFENNSGENLIFQGKGYLAEFVSSKFENTAVFPIEVKKVYCNENSGIYYKAIIDSISKSMVELAERFFSQMTPGISYYTLNNLSKKSEDTQIDEVSVGISELMQRNFVVSNEGEYTQQEIEHLISNKTPEVLSERILNAFLVYAMHGDKVVACGVLMEKEDKLEAKMLNVDKEFKGKGMAGIICDIRESFARSLGYKEIYIESLKFENTVNFHTKRGFRQVPSPRKLKYSIYMCKTL